jgi:hypothetical protein
VEHRLERVQERLVLDILLFDVLSLMSTIDDAHEAQRGKHGAET